MEQEQTPHEDKLNRQKMSSLNNTVKWALVISVGFATLFTSYFVMLFSALGGIFGLFFGLIFLIFSLLMLIDLIRLKVWAVVLLTLIDLFMIYEVFLVDHMGFDWPVPMIVIVPTVAIIYFWSNRKYFR